jgi:PPK2 family polyphosphate:nucleotide phosphotransferase
MSKKFLVPKDKKVELHKYDSDDTGKLKNKDEIAAEYDKLKNRLEELQDMLIAGKKYAVLIVFQGMDCSGKDGVIKNALSGINPQGLQVTSFKTPTAEEQSHDFLWRAHKAVPGKGYIAAFNRSYYEDVLITRVHKLITEEEAKRRMKHINHFESLLVENDVIIIKIFLHISKKFQIEKLEERLQDPQKNWKFDKNDFAERGLWDKYESAYEDVFETCNKKASPWYIVPANHRWYRNYAVLQIVVDTMEKLQLEYPVVEIELQSILQELEKREVSLPNWQ